MMAFDANSDLGEAQLMAGYAAGDASAAQILATRLTPRVFAHAFRLLGDGAEAEDVTQEAMLKLWHIAPNWDAERAQVRTWLYRVVANLCTDLIRKRRAGTDDEMGEIIDDAPSAEAKILQQKRDIGLREALLELPLRQRQAVVLRHIEELSNPEIAQIMDIGVEAVESLTARGKRGLAAILAGQKHALGYEDD